MLGKRLATRYDNGLRRKILLAFGEACRWSPQCSSLVIALQRVNRRLPRFACRVANVEGSHYYDRSIPGTIGQSQEIS